MARKKPSKKPQKKNIRAKAKPAKSKAAVAPKPAKRIKGKTPHFFEDPAVDKVLTMVMNLAAEISVLRDRLDTHERLAAKGAFTTADVEAYEAGDDVNAAREAWRKRFLDKLIKAVES